MSAGSRLKAPAKWLVARGVPSAARALPLRAGVALVYHAVGLLPGDPLRELVPNVGAASFREHVAYLRRRFRLVRASELADAVASRRRGDLFPVALTFDDDLRSHLDVVAPMLRELRAPATFFLNGRRLGRDDGYWWVDLQLAVDAGRLEALPHVTPGALAAARARAPRGIHRLAKELEWLPPDALAEVAALVRERTRDLERPDLLDADGIRALAGSGEVGFHTRDHLVLPRLDDAALRAAMTRGRDEVAAAAGVDRLRMIAYPHGKADERVAAEARAAGFDAAFTGRPAAITPTADCWLLGRTEPSPSDSAAAVGFRIVHLLRPFRR